MDLVDDDALAAAAAGAGGLMRPLGPTAWILEALRLYAMAVCAVSYGTLLWLLSRSADTGWTTMVRFNAYGEGPLELAMFAVAFAPVAILTAGVVLRGYRVLTGREG